LDRISDFVFVTDLDGKIRYVNHALAKQIGLHPNQAAGQSASDLFSINAPVLIQKAVADGRCRASFTHWGNRKQEVDVFGFLLRDKQGQPVGVAVVVQPAEDDHASERELLHVLLENIPDTIYFKDAKSRFIKANRAQAKLLGVDSPDAVLGRTDFDFFQEEFARVAFQDEQRILKSKQALVGKEERIQFADGRVQWLTATKVPVIGDNGKVKGLVGISRDITKEKVLQQQMLVAQKMASVSSLASGIAHEFNNLLTGILGYAELLTSQLPADDPRRRHATQIEKAAREASELTKQLSVFSHHGLLEGRDVLLKDIVEDARRVVAGSVGTEVNIVSRNDCGDAMVKADTDLLRQAIINVLMNACEASPPGGDVLVQVEKDVMSRQNAHSRYALREGTYAVINITDRGAGMDEECRARAFEPFFTTKTNRHHAGLGLTAAYGILEAHGGLLELESIPGQGTRVRLYLPVLEKIVPSKPVQLTAPGLVMSTILLVEDEEIPREFQSHVLESEGFRVLRGCDGQQGLELFTEYEREIDLVVTDIVMPRMSGDALVSEIRKSGSKVKVLVVSGYTVGNTADRLRELGVDAFLQKPFTGQNLLSQVRQMLNLASPLKPISVGAE
jgi:PAS domain S-box-containing protein